MTPLLELIEIEDNWIYQDAQHESYLSKKFLILDMSTNCFD
jgi:hypothetical protein